MADEIDSLLQQMSQGDPALHAQSLQGLRLMVTQLDLHPHHHWHPLLSQPARRSSSASSEHNRRPPLQVPRQAHYSLQTHPVRGALRPPPVGASSCILGRFHPGRQVRWSRWHGHRARRVSAERYSEINPWSAKL